MWLAGRYRLSQHAVGRDVTVSPNMPWGGTLPSLPTRRGAGRYCLSQHAVGRDVKLHLLTDSPNMPWGTVATGNRAVTGQLEQVVLQRL